MVRFFAEPEPEPCGFEWFGFFAEPEPEPCGFEWFSFLLNRNRSHAALNGSGSH
jgi:hypothetical protein